MVAILLGQVLILVPLRLLNPYVVLGGFYFSLEEAKGRPDLLNEDPHLLEKTHIVLNLSCQHVNFSVPAQHFVLLVHDL